VNRTPILYALVAALANVLGAAAVTWRARWSVRALDTMIALAAGFMISASLTDIFPEAVSRGGHLAAVAALLGYLLVHLTQHTLAPHFHFGEETHEVSELVGISALIGLLLHTFVDGVAIASSFHVSQGLGTLVFLAIVLHKLPEGLAISSLFLAAGAPRGGGGGGGAGRGRPPPPRRGRHPRRTARPPLVTPRSRIAGVPRQLRRRFPSGC
jgi:zinc and cadmium transporter